MTIPFVVFGNEELEGKPRIRAGDKITCPSCKEQHVVKAGKDTKTGKAVLHFYSCGEKTYLAGVGGRRVV